VLSKQERGRKTCRTVKKREDRRAGGEPTPGSGAGGRDTRARGSMWPQGFCRGLGARRTAQCSPRAVGAGEKVLSHSSQASPLKVTGKGRWTGMSEVDKTSLWGNLRGTL
jgi:hypothetical protein